MPFLDLPNELVAQVIENAVYDAGFCHAAKLRLVNRSFDIQVLRAYGTQKLFNRNFGDVEWDKYPKSVNSFITKYLLQRPHAASDPTANFACLSNYVVDELLKYDDEPSQYEDLRYEYMHTVCKWRCWSFGIVRSYIFVEGQVSGNKKHAVFAAAAYLGRIDIINDMIEQPEIRGSIKDMDHRTFGSPIVAAIEQGHCDIVCFLLNHGSDVNQTPHYRSSSLLSVAIRAGQIQMIDLFLQPQYGIDTSGTKLDHAIACSLEKNLPDVTQLLLSKLTDDVSTCRDLLSDGLRAACRYGMLDIVRYLLDNGGSPDENMSSNRSCYHPEPLCQAAWSGQDDVVRLLLDRGANLRQSGGSTIQAAAWGCHISTIRVLIDHGLRKEHVGVCLFSVIRRALDSMSPDAGKFLLMLQENDLFDINHLDDDPVEAQGQLAELVGHACGVGCIGFLQVLHELGVDIDANDDRGLYTRREFPPPIMCAKSRKQSRMIDYLLSIGVRDADPLDSCLLVEFARGRLPVEPGPLYECRMPWRI